MTISIWGWGSCASVVTTWGWGEIQCDRHIPIMWAQYLGDSYAYSCVIKRDYVEVQSRLRDIVVLRVKPSNIPERYRLDVLQRIAASMIVRGYDLQVLERNYAEILVRAKDEVLLRTRSTDIPDRSATQIAKRSATDVPIRSSGWPSKSDEICE